VLRESVLQGEIELTNRRAGSSDVIEQRDGDLSILTNV
jgi:hypothetical protein